MIIQSLLVPLPDKALYFIRLFVSNSALDWLVEYFARPKYTSRSYQRCSRSEFAGCHRLGGGGAGQRQRRQPESPWARVDSESEPERIMSPMPIVPVIGVTHL